MLLVVVGDAIEFTTLLLLIESSLTNVVVLLISAFKGVLAKPGARMSECPRRPGGVFGSCLLPSNAASPAVVAVADGCGEVSTVRCGRLRSGSGEVIIWCCVVLFVIIVVLFMNAV